MSQIHETTSVDSPSFTHKDGEIIKFGIKVPPLPPSEIPIVIPPFEHMPAPDDYTWQGIRSNIHKAITPFSADTSLLVTEVPPKYDEQFGVSVHQIAPDLRNVVSFASGLAQTLNEAKKPSLVTAIKSVGPYINFKIDLDAAGESIVAQIESMGERYGEQNIGNGEVVVIDCSSPNIAKHMSVGHLRSTVIGESLARIYRAAGFTAIRDNHLGDWGTQFGMLGRAVELWGEEIPDLRDGANPVNGLYQLYVRMHDEIAAEKERIGMETGVEDAETDLEREGRAWFLRLEQGDPAAREMWKWSMAQSLAEFQRVYDLLGVDFEYQLGESQYVDMLPDVVKAFQDQGLAGIDGKGRVSIDLTDRNLNPLVIQKSDGTSLYQTRDLATLVARDAWFDPAKILYVVGGDQIDYFKQVFAAHEKLAADEAPSVKHVSFGMVSLPEGRMSTRRGRVVFLEDVIRESIDRARQKITVSGRELPDEKINEIARKVGVGAVIYSDLGEVRERKITFDLEKALSFEGNSGPYLQYAHARAKAILRRAEELGITLDKEQGVIFEQPQEIELVKQLGRYPESIPGAIADNQPNVVAVYTYATADRFNKLYNSTPVLQEPDQTKRNSRLRLTAASAQVIENGIHLLGMEAPEMM